MGNFLGGKDVGGYGKSVSMDLETALQNHKVVMVSKSYCPYCTRAKKVLKEFNLSPEDYVVIECDK